eukprot:1160372-Pelagomonas_calceolata.AAC.7
MRLIKGKGFLQCQAYVHTHICILACKPACINGWMVNESQLFTRKDGGETRKRSIVLRDMSNKSIDLTLWGNFADNPGDGLEEVCGDGVRGQKGRWPSKHGYGWPIPLICAVFFTCNDNWNTWHVVLKPNENYMPCRMGVLMA